MTSVIELIKMLYSESFFSEWKSMKEVKLELENKGFNFSDALIGMSLKNSVKKNILSKRKNSRKIEYSQRAPPEIKIKEKKVTEINEILSEITKKKLGERFQQDIKELNISFNYDCGNSAAFLLRKILEKTIFHVFSTNNKISLLKDKQKNFFGLEKMIEVCSREKIKGINILLPKTAKQLLGIKFLGDSAAHDYLANVELIDINPQLSYWVMAIKQLISHLK